MKALAHAPGATLASQRLIALRPLSVGATLPGALTAQPGGFATRRLGQGMETADARAYAAGDDIRHLDRAATMRTGRLHIRRLQEERDRVTLLIADFRSEMFWGLRRAFRSVAAAEALALFGWRRVEEGGRVALLALTPLGPFVAPPRGRVRGMLDVIGGMVEAHRTALAALSAGEERPDPPLDQSLVHADRLAPAGAELLIASGFDEMGAALPDRLDALARRRRPRLILITDAEDLPAGRYPVRVAGRRPVLVRLGRSRRDAEGIGRDRRRIAGREALVVNASDPIETTAARLLRPRSERAA